jgi:hypothetical protein
LRVLPELEPVLDKVIQPIPNPLQIRGREASQCGLDLLNFAHGCRAPQRPTTEKLKLGKLKSEGGSGKR